jgi:CRISPR-associated protein Cas2
MNERPLYLAAYDITDNRDRAAACELLKGFSVGGQKSVYECFLSEAEKRKLVCGVSGIVGAHDRFLMLRIDPRSVIRTLGRGVAPKDPPFFYVG